MAKKTIIRLTESDLHQIIKESAMKIIKEWDRDEWDEEPDRYEPQFNHPTVYVNLDTHEMNHNDIESDGTWVEVSLYATDWHIENDGIGSYEFWGHPGYDEGSSWAVADDCDIDSIDGAWIVNGDDIEDIDTDSIQIPDELVKEISEYAIDNELFEEQ